MRSLALLDAAIVVRYIFTLHSKYPNAVHDYFWSFLPILPNHPLIYAVHHYNPQLLSSLVVVMYYNNSPQLIDFYKTRWTEFYHMPKKLEDNGERWIFKYGPFPAFLYVFFFWDITRLHNKFLQL